MNRDALLSGVWISLACVLGVAIAHIYGVEIASQYFAAYVVEKALSVDNLFVFYIIFRFFRMSVAEQHRALAWGIAGALVARGIFIVSGVALISQFHWLLYVCGAFLVWTGVKLLIAGDDDAFDPAEHFLLKRLTGKVSKFVMVICIIETSDILFALDSIPAALSVSQIAWVVYASNIMAVMGLRSLYFLLAQAIDRLDCLKYGISLVLVMIGAKMLVSYWIEIPTAYALGLTLLALGGSVVASLVRPKVVQG